ncbi:MAG TPA: GAF domain-containing protein [Candidatus Krumholzibacteria bacterium]|nr:GAF domain-containing protein [Candidatus Krumholzibacteria bacterium]
MGQRNRILIGSWLVAWGVLLLLVSNRVLLGWEHIWPCILIVSGVVMLRVFQNRLSFGVVFAASWAILLGAFLTAFSTGFIDWGRMGALWPAIPMVIGVACFIAGKSVASNAGIVIGALVILMSATSFLYKFGIISERVAAPFIRFWPLVLVLAGFVLMKRRTRIIDPAIAAQPGPRVNPFDAGALSSDAEDEIIARVRAARGSRGAAAILVNELKSRFERFAWVGIYRLHGDILTLDEAEYVGQPPEHRRIHLSEGVCGSAASERATQIVPDVCNDPRYLACSPTVKSEIVVPIFHAGNLIGVLDIDSDHPDAFSDDDRRFLESLVAKVSRAIRQEPVAAA